MIPVPRPKKPRHFDEQVRRPGNEWLSRNSSAKPPSYWRRVQPELARAFSNRCGYTAMFDLLGTVDHFVPQSRDRRKLYEWDNLRYASHWINSSKRDCPAILDPYDVKDGWFEVSLPSLQLVASKHVPASMRKLVQSTLDNLPIVHDERVIRQRRAWLHEYEAKRITLDGLRMYAPLLAAAIEKQQAVDEPQRTRKKSAKKRSTRR